MSKQFQCQYEGCEKSYKSSSSLYSHVRYKHLNIKFKCQYDGCPREYTTKQGLTTHMDKFHIRDTIYGCHECRYRAFSYQDVVFHMSRTGHREHKTPYIVEKVQSNCNRIEIEDKSAKQIQWNLSPDSDGLYQCNQDGCKYRSNRAGVITEHIKNIHLFPNRTTCSVCNTSLSSVWYLNYHMENIHGYTNNQTCKPAVGFSLAMVPTII